MLRTSNLMFVLLIAALVRLPNLTSPLIGAHSWRQTDTAAMARNYIEVDMNPLHPRVDWGGNGSGIVESEFPLYQYSVALLYKVFGIHESIGRLVSIFSSLLSLVFYYFLMRRLFDERIAFYSTFALAILPLYSFYGRTFMPEATMMMFTILGVFLFVKWAQEDSTASLIAAAGAITVACLMKITTLYVGFLLLFICWQKSRWKFLADLRLWAFALFTLCSVAAWYTYAHSTYLDGGGVTVGIWDYGTGKWGNWDLVLQGRFWNRLVFQSIAERHLTWTGFIVFVVGLFIARVDRRHHILDAWLGAVVIYFVVVAKGNYVHEYYQLPFLPPAAAYIGLVFSKYFVKGAAPVWKPIVLGVAAFGICVLGTSRLMSYWQFEDPKSSVEFAVSQALASSTSPQELACVLDRDDPTIFYLSHRKGWNLATASNLKSRLEDLRSKGCTAFAGVYSYVDKQSEMELRRLLQSMNLVVDSSSYFVARLSQ